MISYYYYYRYYGDGLMAEIKQLNFNRKKKELKKKKIKYVVACISMPKNLFEKIEGLRGRTPRSVFITDILAEKLGVVLQ